MRWRTVIFFLLLDIICSEHRVVFFSNCFCSLSFLWTSRSTFWFPSIFSCLRRTRRPSLKNSAFNCGELKTPCFLSFMKSWRPECKWITAFGHDNLVKSPLVSKSPDCLLSRLWNARFKSIKVVIFPMVLQVFFRWRGIQRFLISFDTQKEQSDSVASPWSSVHRSLVVPRTYYALEKLSQNAVCLRCIEMTLYALN